MLITAGEQDFRVPVDAEPAGLHGPAPPRRRGALLSFPAEGHWINRPQNCLLWHREVYGWLRRFLRP